MEIIKITAQLTIDQLKPLRAIAKKAQFPITDCVLISAGIAYATETHIAGKVLLGSAIPDGTYRVEGKTELLLVPVEAKYPDCGRVFESVSPVFKKEGMEFDPKDGETVSRFVWESGLSRTDTNGKVSHFLVPAHLLVFLPKGVYTIVQGKPGSPVLFSGTGDYIIMPIKFDAK